MQRKDKYKEPMDVHWLLESNFRSTLCFKSGYHSNWYRDLEPNSAAEDQFWREQQALSFFSAILGYILRERRWWFHHPRYHFWHWRFQLHPLEAFKRWAFTRCNRCGGRFKYGETGVSSSWNSKGPRWFKSEDLAHMDCLGSGVKSSQ